MKAECSINLATRYDPSTPPEDASEGGGNRTRRGKMGPCKGGTGGARVRGDFAEITERRVQRLCTLNGRDTRSPDRL